jgi:hypothetical protein
MNSVELPYFVIFSVLIILTPFIPSNFLILFDSLIIRIGIVLILLFLISVGPTAGLFGLLAIGVIYLERNRRKIQLAKQKIDLMDVNMPSQMSVEEESISQKTLPVLDFNTPNTSGDVPYLPTNECGTDNFEPVDSTINNKKVLPVIQNGEKSNKLYERLGFGHLKGVETLGNN